jgi:hypothetical protein
VRQIDAVSIDATNKHAVLLYQSKAGRCLTCPSENVLVACFPQKGKKAIGFGCNPRAAGKCVERYTLAEEQIADWAAYRGAVGDLLTDCVTLFDMPLNTA